MSNNENSLSMNDLQILLGEQWSNAAACGYAIKACEGVGLSHEQIKQILREMECAFDCRTVDEAKNIYYRF